MEHKMLHFLGTCRQVATSIGHSMGLGREDWVSFLSSTGTFPFIPDVDKGG